MKIVAFMGSPRFGGNTELLLDAILHEAKANGADIRKHRLYSMNFSPCIECGGCDETGICILKDDFTPIYHEMDEAQWIIMASPIFFYNISSRAQAVVERSQAHWVRKYILKQTAKEGRKGLFVSVGATKGKLLFQGVQRVMRYFFDAIDAELAGSMLFRGIEKKGAISTHPTAIATAKVVGRAMALGKEITGIEGVEV